MVKLKSAKKETHCNSVIGYKGPPSKLEPTLSLPAQNRGHINVFYSWSKNCPAFDHYGWKAWKPQSENKGLRKNPEYLKNQEEHYDKTFVDLKNL